MAIKRSIGYRNLDTRWSAFDGGDCRMNVYGTPQPANADASTAATLLGTLTPSSDVFGTPASGAAAMNSVTSDSDADASGTAVWVRIYSVTAGQSAPTAAADSDDMRIDLTIGTDISIDNAEVVEGGVIALTGWTMTETA